MIAEMIIKYNTKGTGFKARCSGCGKLIRFASGCNAPGLRYAEAGAKEDFKKHNCPVKEQ